MKSKAPKWHRGARLALAAVTSLWGAACSEHAPAETSPLGRAKEALTALVEQDGIEVAECRELADRCSERFIGAAPAEVCARQAQLCDSLEARLSELREPAVLCWQRSIQMCGEDGADRARCQEKVTACEVRDDELARSCNPVLSCGERVEDCLVHAADVAASGAACERIAAACVRVEKPMAAHRAER
jgi:hypothetical protein